MTESLLFFIIIEYNEEESNEEIHNWCFRSCRTCCRLVVIQIILGQTSEYQSILQTSINRIVNNYIDQNQKLISIKINQGETYHVRIIFKQVLSPK